MSGNSIGKVLVITTFGESHGPAVGGVLDGFPSNILIDVSFIQSELNRRKTKSWFYASARNEEDEIEILSGIFENKSTGAPIAFIVRNKNARPADYKQLKDVYRPSHADFTWEMKYGIRDYLGGGRSSARETVARVAGGAIAKLLLNNHRISILSYVSQIGTVKLPDGFTVIDPDTILKSPVLCPDEETSHRMIALLENLKSEGDTTGGIINCIISGVPVGLGEPVFDKLQADLAKAMLSINAVKGFEYGSGFGAAAMKGSEHNDPFVFKDNHITTSTNFSGGIQGGISNGNEIFFRVAFKPPPTLMRDQKTVNSKGQKVILKGKGRHDVCMVPRALPIVEAMAALVLADHLIRNTK
ncbi:MAG: chorismate synthase [Bacteroidetes bacterium]|nr:chorismate synthase [Bacteroidota bacterium]